MVLKTHLFIKIFRLLYRSFVFIYVSMYVCIYLYIYIYGYLNIKGKKQEFSTIFAFTFTHRYTGTNKSRWRNVTLDLVI